MTVAELKKALENVPDDTEVFMNDGYSYNGIPVDYAEYYAEYNALVLH